MHISPGIWLYHLANGIIIWHIYLTEFDQRPTKFPTDIIVMRRSPGFFLLCQIILLSCRSVNGNKLNNEQDVPQTYRTATYVLKPWTIFMEMRVYRCLNQIRLSHSDHTATTIQYLWCVGSIDKRVTLYNTGKHNTVKNGLNTLTSMWKHTYIPNEIDLFIYTLAVHKAYSIKLSFMKFCVFDDKFYRWNMGWMCHDVDIPYINPTCSTHRNRLTVVLDTHEYHYCGARYPWQLYGRGNTVKFVFSHPNTVMSFTYVKLQFSLVVPKGIVSICCSSTTLRYVSGTHKIQLFLVKVDAMYRMRITLSKKTTARLAIHDGPDKIMPLIGDFGVPNQEGFTHISCSTHQIFICQTDPLGDISNFSVKYVYMLGERHRILVDESPQGLHVINNTGCGKAPPSSWQCLYKFEASNHQQIQINIHWLLIQGTYAGHYTAAGMAAYNVEGNLTTIIGHWVVSDGLQKPNRPYILTSSKQVFFLVFYGYAPHATVSARVTVVSTLCVGVFMETMKTTLNNLLVNSKHGLSVNLGLALNEVGTCFKFHTNYVSDKDYDHIVYRLIMSDRNAAQITISAFYRNFYPAKNVPFCQQSYDGILYHSYKQRNIRVMLGTYSYYEIHDCDPVFLVTIEVLRIHCTLAHVEQQPLDICKHQYYSYMSYYTENIYMAADSQLSIKPITTKCQFIRLHTKEMFCGLLVTGQYALSMREHTLGFWGYPLNIAFEINEGCLLQTTWVRKPTPPYRAPCDSPKAGLVNRLEWRNFMYTLYFTGEDARASWEDAKTHCELHSSYLVTLHGNEETGLVVEVFMRKYGLKILYVGLERQVCESTSENNILADKLMDVLMTTQ